jgi:hypothetical protein
VLPYKSVTNARRDTGALNGSALVHGLPVCAGRCRCECECACVASLGPLVCVWRGLVGSVGVRVAWPRLHAVMTGQAGACLVLLTRFHFKISTLCTQHTHTHTHTHTHIIALNT